MKAIELRKMSLPELKTERTKMLKEQFKVKIAHSTGNLANFNKLKYISRSIARINTLLTEKSRGQEA